MPLFPKSHDDTILSIMENTDANTSKVGRESDKFMLRLPDGMRDQIAEAAKANNRSMNAEIVARLEKSFAPTDPTANEALALAARLQADLAQEQLERHKLLIELSDVAGSLQTFVSETGALTGDGAQRIREYVEESLDVESFVKQYLHADEWLSSVARQRIESLKDAYEAEKKALGRLAKSADFTPEKS